jgi:hypothetical protein
MEQHPIPQNISSYQFRLVGDMTLKQFFQLAGGILAGIIFYSVPIIGIVKWPLAIISVILGIALAFMPLEERPLEKWIFAFFKAIYTPTEFFWKKTTVAKKYFQDEAVGVAPTSGSPEQEAALKNYLSGTKPANSSLATLEGAEEGFLSKLSGIFSGLIPQTGSPAGEAGAAVAAVVEKKNTEIPQNMPTVVIQPNTPRLFVEEKAKEAPTAQVTTNQVSPIMAGDEIVSTKQAIFSIDAAPPNPPTTPNVVVGQVVDEQRKIVEGAIMEIRDEVGRPVRALRSNKVGHFITVTPLDSGRYDIVTEKDGYQFSPVSFDAAGALIPPILVSGKKIAASTVPIVQQQVNQSINAQPMAQF